MYNLHRHLSLTLRGEAIEQIVVEEGLRLTAIGMGTAFALLLLLMLLIVLMGRLVGHGPDDASGDGLPIPRRSVHDDRDRALAAVVAVSALMEKSTDADRGGGDTS